MSEHTGPGTAESYREKDNRPRDFYGVGLDGSLKPYDMFTPAERRRNIADLKSARREAQKELDAILNSPNSTAPVYKFRTTIDEVEAHLRALGVDDPDAPTDEEIAEARHAAGLDNPLADEMVDPVDIAEPDPNA
jgi:NifB/MoaA-like Fe-S oxidoreductase